MGGLTMEKLLTGKYKRWLGVAWWFLMLVVLILPDVDHTIAQYHEQQALQTKLAVRNGLPEHARMLANCVEQKQKELAGLEVALVPADTIAKFKQDITSMIRASSCRLRTMHPGAITRKSFDETLNKPADGLEKSSKKSEWEVEERISEVSIEGSFENLMDFISALDEDARVLQLASLRIRTLSNTHERLILNLGITTFDILRSRPKG